MRGLHVALRFRISWPGLLIFGLGFIALWLRFRV